MSQREVLLQIKNMYKNFGATVALNNVSFEMCRGEIRGLVGENGSGKSTVSSIVAGIQPATKGDMVFKGQPWKPASTLAAQQGGVGMIVQEAGTIANITVAENIFLGHEDLFKDKTKLFVSKTKMNAACQALFDELGITGINPHDRTAMLDMQQRKIVEIAKALYWKPEILIVDETTTALSHEGREFLYKTILRLKEEGKCVLLISHDLDEMTEYCDILTVLRDGVIIGSLEKAEYDQNVIRKMMVGREVKGDYYRNDYEPYSDEVVLRAENVTTARDLLCFSLELHKGEILGIGGLSHCGMRTVGRALFGLEKILDGQVVLYNGTEKKVPKNNFFQKAMDFVFGKRVDENGNTLVKDPHTAVNNSMGYISKDRDNESLGLSATISENIASTGYKINNFLYAFINPIKEAKYVDKQVQDLMIKCSSKHANVNTLSGGNKQKVAFGKWMACDAQVIIMDCPTRGVDVGVKAAMYDIINKMKQAGKSIVLISEELQELIGMSDRILIMKDGEITHEAMRSPDLNEHSLIDYMI